MIQNNHRLRHFLLTAVSTLFVLSSTAADGVLKGSPISSPAASATGADKAFDNDYETYYASDARSNTWVGLDLGTPHIISRIGYAPRQGYQSRMKLGIFEGANEADFSDAVPLSIVVNVPDDKRIAYVLPKCSRAFRYVRYITPNDCRCNVSELRFYGHEAAEGESNDSHFPTLTGLPVVSIRTTGGKEINSLTEWRDGTVTMIWDNGESILEDTMRIRGRGNASWGFPKKPYRIKLAHKAKPLGMNAKAKDWTLINNYGDKTLMRNLIAFDYAERLGMKWTAQSKLADVIVNGEYEGTYQFTDQIEVNKRRVDVAKVDDIETPGDPVTGGFLLEVDNNYTKEAVHFKSLVYGMPMVVHYPDDDEITPEQLDYIKNHLATWENSVKQYDAKRDTFLTYTAYMDVNSFMQHFLVGELSANTDTYHSTYLYKERGEDRFTFGPVWDFDIAFDNDSRTHSFLSQSYTKNKQWLYWSGYATVSPGIGTIATRLVKYSEDVLQEEWSRARVDGGLTPENTHALIDSLASSMNKSQELNFTRWPILNSVLHMNYTARGSFKKEVDYLKKFVTNRFAWMDAKIGIDLQYTGMEAPQVIPEGVVMTIPGGIRLEGFPEGSVVSVNDLTGRSFHTTSIEEFDTDIPLDEGIYIISVRQTDNSLHTFKVACKGE